MPLGPFEVTEAKVIYLVLPLKNMPRRSSKLIFTNVLTVINDPMKTIYFSFQFEVKIETYLRLEFSIT